MDSGVHRFSRNVRKGQRRPVGTDRMTRKAFSSATAQPSTVISRAWDEDVVTGMNVNNHCTRLRGFHECGPVNGVIMIDVMRWRGE